MTTERFKINPPELERGINLANQTIVLTSQAILESYPLIKDFDAYVALPHPDNIVFLPIEEILEYEKSVRPGANNIIYRSLEISGVSTDFLDKKYYESPSAEIFSESHHNAPTFVSQDVLDEFSSVDFRTRLGAVIGFSEMLIHHFLEKAPTPRPLNSYPWSEIVRERSKIIYNPDNFQDEPNVKSRKLLQAKRMNSSLLDSETKFVAQGVMIHTLLPSQSLTDSELTIGNTFASGVSKHIANRIIPTLKKKTIESGIFYSPWITGARTREENYSLDICNKINGVDPKSQQEFMALYLDSLIPNYIVANREAANNEPWNYPQ